MPKTAARGDKVRYRSFAGSVYDAVVLGDRADGYVDIGVIIPTCKDSFELHAIKYEDRPALYTCAWPTGVPE